MTDKIPDWVEDPELYQRMLNAKRSEAITVQEYRAYKEVDERIGPEEGGLTAADLANPESEKITKALQDWAKVADVSGGARAIGKVGAVGGAAAGGLAGWAVGAEVGAAVGTGTALGATAMSVAGGAGVGALAGPSEAKEVSAAIGAVGGAFLVGAGGGLVGGTVIGAGTGAVIGAAGGAVAGAGVGATLGGVIGGAKELIVDRALGGQQKQIENMRNELTAAYEGSLEPSPTPDRFETLERISRQRHRDRDRS